MVRLAGIIVALGLAWHLRSGGERAAVISSSSFRRRRKNGRILDFDRRCDDQRPDQEAILASAEPPHLFGDGAERRRTEAERGILEQGLPCSRYAVRVLVNDRQGSNELLVLDFNPFGNPADRGWHDLTIDLSEYAGETVDLLFNTNASPPQRSPKDDRNGDFPLWAQPRIVGR